MADYALRFIELPIRVEGVTLPNSEGGFDIYINSLLPEEKRRLVLEHELRHIEAEHFYLEMSVEQMERQAAGEPLALALCPPLGQLAHFSDEAALAAYVKRLVHQRDLNF